MINFCCWCYLLYFYRCFIGNSFTVKLTVKRYAILPGSSFTHLMFTESLDCLQRPNPRDHGERLTQTMQVRVILNNVHTLVKSPNGAFLRMYPHHYATHDCISHQYFSSEGLLFSPLSHCQWTQIMKIG